MSENLKANSRTESRSALIVAGAMIIDAKEPWGGNAMGWANTRSHHLRIMAVVVGCSVSAGNADVAITAESTVKFATMSEGKEILGATDAFVSRMSPIDRELRLQSEGQVSKEKYLAHASSQVLEWSRAEIEKLTGVFGSIKSDLAWVRASLPPEIPIVKVSRDCEGGAPHTRGIAIVLPVGLLNAPPELMRHILLHELFHIMVKQNPKIRAELYRIVGFDTTNEIEMPGALRERLITNPDAPNQDVVITVHSDGKTAVVTPVLLSNVSKYNSRDKRHFPLGYLDFKLMQVEQTDSGWRPKLVSGDVVLMNPTGVSGYPDKTGSNTEYIIHPEEILADNFAFLVMNKKDVPSPKILAALRRVIAK